MITRKKKLASPSSLAAFAPDKDRDVVRVIVETPKGSQNKYKFDEQLGIFKLSSVLPVGAVFPFDFGYIPDTKAEDGDPIDVLLLADAPAFPGCLIESRLIGVIEAEQTEEGKTARNDRLIAVAIESRTHNDLRSIEDLSDALRSQIEHFFASYSREQGKTFKVIGQKGARVAQTLLENASTKKLRKRA